MKTQTTPRTKITIGLCVKNSERTIKKCLESIINQEYPHELMEIIIVDGGSKDKTAHIAKRLISTSDIVSRFYSDNGEGLGLARQIVLDNTNTEYIVWVDSDVLISKDFVKNQVEFIEKKRQVGVAAGKYIHRKAAQATLPAMLESLGKYVGSIEFTYARNPRGLPPNDASIYRVGASKQVGGFDRKIKGAAEDEDIITRMKKKSWLVSVNEKAEYYAFPRETWSDLWTERLWFGYGKHYLSHKHGEFRAAIYINPLVFVFVGFKLGLKAYRLTLQKKSFLIPLAYVFCTMAWWYGFIKGHIDGYGHKKS